MVVGIVSIVAYVTVIDRVTGKLTFSFFTQKFMEESIEPSVLGSAALMIGEVAWVRLAQTIDSSFVSEARKVVTAWMTIAFFVGVGFHFKVVGVIVIDTLKEYESLTFWGRILAVIGCILSLGTIVVSFLTFWWVYKQGGWSSIG